MDPQPDVEPPVGKGPFTCEYCNTTLEKWPQYKKHLKHHLEDKPYRCCECQASFNVQVQLSLFLVFLCSIIYISMRFGVSLSLVPLIDISLYVWLFILPFPEKLAASWSSTREGQFSVSRMWQNIPAFGIF